MISVTRLSKFYGSFSALSNVSFEIKKGEVVGFLGTNGAGKTTLMRILTTYLQPSLGIVHIDGYRLGKDDLKIRRKIGYLPEVPPLYPSMTVEDYLKFSAQLKDVSQAELKSQIDYVLGECYLLEVRSKTIMTLSKGFKQRVGIAQALIGNPDILILDEPTSGLDPVQIIQVRSLIKKIGSERIVIVSSHILSEMEELAKRLLIIKEGKIVLDGNLDQVIHSQHQNLETIFLKLHGQAHRAYEKSFSYNV